MKVIKAGQKQFVFEIEPRERLMLRRVLGLYPLVPLAHHQLSKGAHSQENQELLEEAMNQERLKNKQQVDALLKSRSRFRKTEHGYRFSLKPEQMEWMLQVLNDVRVGSWLLLGSPDGPVETFAALTQENASYFWSMEVASQFQMVLLNAMERG